MTITGKNIIGYTDSAKGKATFQGVTASANAHQFHTATTAEIESAMRKAQDAFGVFNKFSAARRKEFLHAIAAGIEALGDQLIRTAMQETGLPEARLLGERGRTCYQLRLYADYAAEGSWVEAILDSANPERQPQPKPDLRKMLVPLGPVVVFTASNFPFAYSTAGGDTASALAAGCPVIVKAHEAHPATNELVARAIQQAAKATDMPDGVFSSLNGDYKTGQALVRHPLTAAVGFTGSHRGGRALFDLANRRPKPIPVFAEMGSVNPVFLLPQILQTQLAETAQKLAASTSMNAGQFCTCPGLIFLPEGSAKAFGAALSKAMSAVQTQCMLNHRIFDNYQRNLHLMLQQSAVTPIVEGAGQDAPNVLPSCGLTTAAAFLKNPHLQEEVFGPFTLLVSYRDGEELRQAAESLKGQLTASVFGEKHELPHYRSLLDILRERAGRLNFNGVPTGVEVAHAMQHGGPYPSTTDSRFTSVGQSALKRFARPVAFQNFPQELLPDALKDGNPLGIWRWVDGGFCKA